ncbi:expressed protein [Phakopsora pachyrhizi]|uniref:Expressed protein n=1 Tax=Phakopsora pachyrhizi TaxID=170000 RepID=A0AAV0B2X3_PHAPC|nr:expressed protein [Phakopsora pachyrhizi]
MAWNNYCRSQALRKDEFESLRSVGVEELAPRCKVLLESYKIYTAIAEARDDKEILRLIKTQNTSEKQPVQRGNGTEEPVGQQRTAEWVENQDVTGYSSIMSANQSSNNLGPRKDCNEDDEKEEGESSEESSESNLSQFTAGQNRPVNMVDYSGGTQTVENMILLMRQEQDRSHQRLLRQQQIFERQQARNEEMMLAIMAIMIMR